MADGNDVTPKADAPAEPVADGPKPKEEPTAYDELKTFMEARDLKSPDDVAGYVNDLGTTEQWQQKYGASENKVGDLRQEVEALKNQVQQQTLNPEYGEQPPVNIRDVVGQEIRSVFQEMSTENQKAQAKWLTDRNDLMKRPGWGDVQPHYDKMVNTPQIAHALQTGNLTQEKLYSQINERVMASKISAFVNQVPEGALKQAAPNTETERTKQPAPESQAKKQRIAKAKDDMDPDALLKELIPDDDPILQF